MLVGVHLMSNLPVLDSLPLSAFILRTSHVYESHVKSCLGRHLREIVIPTGGSHKYLLSFEGPNCINVARLEITDGLRRRLSDSDEFFRSVCCIRPHELIDVVLRLGGRVFSLYCRVDEIVLTNTGIDKVLVGGFSSQNFV